MSIIFVDLGNRGYQIHIGQNLLAGLMDQLDHFSFRKQAALITTPPVAEHYLETVTTQFDDTWQFCSYEVPDGEQSKSSDTAEKIYTWLIEKQFERNSLIISLGGGVVGDLAGFVAATYLRGINLIHLPTSLLAQVDSSVGGKVGINHPLGKNLIGAFYQPKLVVCDVSVLKTLPDVEYICGLGEVIKYGIIAGGSLFHLISQKLDAIFARKMDILTDIVQQCIQIKTDIVMQDEYEQNIRAYLNLGHTFAHALEKYYRFGELKHGQAVLFGIRCAIQVARDMRMISTDGFEQIDNLIQRFNLSLPGNINLDTDALIEIMFRDKKVKDGRINLVLPAGPGEIRICPVDDLSLLEDAFNSIQ
jgi:3-dehydroquinate synthase